MPKRIEERFAFPTGAKVKRPGKDGYTGAYPVIEGVLLCGTTSANRRRYKPEAFAGDRVKRYNGKPVYIDHGDGRKGRGYRDKIGWIENARQRDDGMPVGDIAIKPVHLDAESVLWDAEHKPDFAGMSHVAHCETRTASDGWEEIHEMVDPESVDIVVDPATTKGFFENRRGTVPLTVKQLCEALVKHPKIKAAQVAPLKLLAELAGMDGAMTSMDAPPADDAEPGEPVKDAFCSAIQHVVDQALDGGIDAKEALRQIKELIASHERVKGGKGDKEEPEEEETEESKRKNQKPTVGAVLAECKAKSYTATADDLVILLDLPSEQSRAAYIDRLAEASKPQGTRPSGQTRRPGAGTAGTQQTKEQKNNAGGGNEPPKIPKFDTL